MLICAASFYQESSNNPSTCDAVDKSGDNVFCNIRHAAIVYQEEHIDYVDGCDETYGSVEAACAWEFEDDDILDGNGPNEDSTEED